MTTFPSLGRFRPSFTNALLLALASSLALAGPAGAQTCNTCVPGTCGTVIGPGTVSGETWSPAGSPYCITGDITVAGLTILPGTCVLVDPGARIDVLTLLVANGTADQPISFAARQQSPLGRWKGIRLQNAGTNSAFKFCRIQHASESGIRIVQSQPTIEDCTIRNNTSTGTGGGIDILMTSVDPSLNNFTIRRCTIEGNQSISHGGGINAVLLAGSMPQGLLTLDRCLLAGNGAHLGLAGGDFFGGGLRIAGNSALKNCVFESNVVNSSGCSFCTSIARGGGVYSSAGTATLEHCAFQRNVVQTACGSFGAGHSLGAGMYLSGSASLDNCIFGGGATSGGCTQNSGGGLFLEAGATASVANCTFARNNTGALHAEGTANATIINSIIWENNGTTPNWGPQVTGNTANATVTYSDVMGLNPLPPGCINVNPVFLGIGGPSATQIPDLTIQSFSPCVDAGDPAPQYDDTSFPPSLGGARNDMGAHGGPLAGQWITNALGAFHNYCSVNPSSLGVPARITPCGTASVANNDLTLFAGPCPSNVAGIFFCGFTQVQVPLANGFRCIGSSLLRLPPVANTGPGGVASRTIDLNGFPLLGVIGPGTVRNFQFYYRDPAAGPGASNTSDALEVFFAP